MFQVLRNIFGPVSLEVKRQNAAVPLRRARGVTDGEDSVTQTIANDEYDFLRPKSPSSTPKARFNDIPSAAVSRLVHAGVVFWGPAAHVTQESDPTNIELVDSVGHVDRAIDEGGEEHEDLRPQGEDLTGLSSARETETDDRPAGQQGSEMQTKLPSETSCVVV